MTASHKITLAAAVVLAVLLVGIGSAWIKEHEAAVVVAAQQKADKEAAAVIAQKEKENQQQLQDQLAALLRMKQSVQTPAQVVAALPQVITLPAPMTQVTQAQEKAASVARLPDAPAIHAGDLVIPQQSVKPFYDAQVECRANAVKLASCDESVANRDAAAKVKDAEIAQLQVALKGGTKWQRFGRTMKAVAIGAAIGGGMVAVAMK